MNVLKSDKEDCISWPFTYTGKEKRPWVQYNGRKGLAAVFICEERNGPKPTPKHHAAHNCGNPKCINPNHLRWATAKENAADKIIHGTLARGEAQGSSKLTSADIISIREMSEYMPKTEIARIFGVANSHIGRIIRKEAWGHI